MYKWITDQTREFLRQGYLSDGENPEDRLFEIIDNASKISPIKDFREKFSNYLSKGFLFP